MVKKLLLHQGIHHLSSYHKKNKLCPRGLWGWRSKKTKSTATPNPYPRVTSSSREGYETNEEEEHAVRAKGVEAKSPKNANIMEVVLVEN